MFYFLANANRAETILENGILSQEAIAQAMDELWIDVLNSPIYDGMAALGIFFFLGTISIWVFTMVKETQEKGEIFMSPEQWLIALAVAVLLMNNGGLLKQQTFNMRNLLNGISQEILESSLVQSQSLITAFNQISREGGIQTWYETQLNECQKITDEEKRKKCLDDALIAANEAADAGLPEQRPNALQRIGSGIANAATFNVGSALETAFIGILLALGVVIQWFTEFTWILTALVGPLAVGGTLLPVKQKAIFTWLIAFYTVGLYKLFFNILIGLTAIVQLKSNSANSLIFAVATGLVSPILAMAMAAGGGMATFTSIGAVASFAGAKLATAATGGAATATKMGVRIGVRNAARIGKAGASNLASSRHPSARRIRALGSAIASTPRARQVVGIAKGINNIAKTTYKDATTPLIKSKRRRGA